MLAETIRSGTWDLMLLWYGIKILKNWHQCLQSPAWPDLPCAPRASLSYVCLGWRSATVGKQEQSSPSNENLSCRSTSKAHIYKCDARLWPPEAWDLQDLGQDTKQDSQQGLARTCSIYGNNGVSDKHNPLLPKAGQAQSPAYSLAVKYSRWVPEDCLSWQWKLILAFALTIVFHFWWALVLLGPHFCKIQIVPPPQFSVKYKHTLFVLCFSTKFNFPKLICTFKATSVTWFFA